MIGFFALPLLTATMAFGQVIPPIRPLPPSTTDMFKPDLSKWERSNNVRGARLEILRGLRAGLALRTMPVKHLRRQDMGRTDMRQLKSGLYLIDLDYIPHFVKQVIAEYKFTLRPDGSLVDAEGQDAKIFVAGETGLVKGESLSPNESINASMDLNNLLMDRYDAQLDPANPYPFRCYSYHPWAVYHGGFHRWYDARTYASSYTTDPAGNCSIQSPRTNIEYLQTYAVVGGGPDVDSCANCNSEDSRDVWDVGYFWPAHGTPTTYHHGVYKDGSIYFSRSSSLTW